MDSTYFRIFEMLKKDSDVWIDKSISKSEYERKSKKAYWQVRLYADRLPSMCLVYLLTKEQKYFVGLKKWMDFYSDLELKWPVDLGRSHLIVAMSLCYDWVFHDFVDSDRKKYAFIINRETLRLLRFVDNKNGWYKLKVHNHNHLNMYGAYVGLEATRGSGNYVEQKTNNYIQEIVESYKITLKVLLHDGASHESAYYLSYSIYGVLGFAKLYSELNGITHLALESNHLKNAGDFRLYASSPNYKRILMYGDAQFVDTCDVVSSLFELASVFKNERIQWFALKMLDVADGYYLAPDSPEMKKRNDLVVQAGVIFENWATFIYYDENIKVSNKFIEEYPLERLFENVGLYVSRSSWIDDQGSLLSIKAGVVCGKFDPKYVRYISSSDCNHVHLDQGTFEFYYNGMSLFPEDGWHIRHKSVSHNIVTVRSGNQRGGIFNGAKIIKVSKENEVEHIVAELSSVYSFFDKYERHFLYVKKKDLIIFDLMKIRGEIMPEFNLHASDNGNYENFGEKIRNRYFEKSGIGFDLVDFSYYGKSSSGNRMETKRYGFEYYEGFTFLSFYSTYVQIVPKSIKENQLFTFKIGIFPFSQDESVSQIFRFKEIEENLQYVIGINDKLIYIDLNRREIVVSKFNASDHDGNIFWDEIEKELMKKLDISKNTSFWDYFLFLSTLFISLAGLIIIVCLLNYATRFRRKQLLTS